MGAVVWGKEKDPHRWQAIGSVADTIGCDDMSNDTVLTRQDGSTLTGRSASGCDRFLVRLKELGATLIETHWLGALTLHEVRCKEGHLWMARPNSVISSGATCRACAGQCPIFAESKFRAAVEARGGVVVGEYRGDRKHIAVICAMGHECESRPGDVSRGHHFCLTCVWAEQDIFYVVSGDPGVKFGITSGNPRYRLWVHKKDGYGTRERLHTGLSRTVAYETERSIRSELKSQGFEPIRGREYFGPGALGLVLARADALLGTSVVAVH